MPQIRDGHQCSKSSHHPVHHQTAYAAYLPLARQDAPSWSPIAYIPNPDVWDWNTPLEYQLYIKEPSISILPIDEERGLIRIRKQTPEEDIPTYYQDRPHNHVDNNQSRILNLSAVGNQKEVSLLVSSQKYTIRQIQPHIYVRLKELPTFGAPEIEEQNPRV